MSFKLEPYISHVIQSPQLVHISLNSFHNYTKKYPHANWNGVSYRGEASEEVINNITLSLSLSFTLSLPISLSLSLSLYSSLLSLSGIGAWLNRDSDWLLYIHPQIHNICNFLLYTCINIYKQLYVNFNLVHIHMQTWTCGDLQFTSQLIISL